MTYIDKLNQKYNCTAAFDLDKCAIQYLVKEGKDVDGIAGLLSLSLTRGDGDYIKHLQKKLKAKNLMDLANKMLQSEKKKAVAKAESQLEVDPHLNIHVEDVYKADPAYHKFVLAVSDNLRKYCVKFNMKSSEIMKMFTKDILENL